TKMIIAATGILHVLQTSLDRRVRRSLTMQRSPTMQTGELTLDGKPSSPAQLRWMRRRIQPARLRMRKRRQRRLLRILALAQVQAQQRRQKRVIARDQQFQTNSLKAMSMPRPADRLPRRDRMLVLKTRCTNLYGYRHRQLLRRRRSDL